jgi:hypothetical protein
MGAVALSFDEEELDPHGECAHEIARLKAECTSLEEIVRARNVQFECFEQQIERLRAMVKQYASECGECGGTGVLDFGDDDVGNAGDPCPVCKDIRAMLP